MTSPLRLPSGPGSPPPDFVEDAEQPDQVDPVLLVINGDPTAMKLTLRGPRRYEQEIAPGQMATLTIAAGDYYVQVRSLQSPLKSGRGRFREHRRYAAYLQSVPVGQGRPLRLGELGEGQAVPAQGEGATGTPSPP